MIFYKIPPIDYWRGAHALDPEQERQIAQAPDAPSGGAADRVLLARELVAALDLAMPVFESWGIGMIVEQWWGVLPGDTEIEVWIAVKEMNDGATYVASPSAIEGLQNIAFEVHACEVGSTTAWIS